MFNFSLVSTSLRKKFAVSFLLMAFLTATTSWAADNNYKTFQTLFTWIDFKPMFIVENIGGQQKDIDNSALKALPEDWQQTVVKWGKSPYKSIAAFHINKVLDGFLVLGPSELNGSNINLLVFDQTGHLQGNEMLTSFSGDEGNYYMKYCWLKDINGDGHLDLLFREQGETMTDDGKQECSSDHISVKLWDGKSFAWWDIPEKKEANLKKETRHDLLNIKNACNKGASS